MHEERPFPSFWVLRDIPLREETAVLPTLPRPGSGLQTLPGTGSALPCVPVGGPDPDPAVFAGAWQRVLEDFWGPFSRALAAVDIDRLIHDVHDLSELPKEKCPNCGGPLIVKSGRFGPYIACAKYPECRFSRPLAKNKVPDRPSDEKCQECGAPMVIKTGRYGESLACTRYPKCKHTRPVPLGVKCHGWVESVGQPK